MNFIPEQPKEAQEVPYFEDVSKDAGWQGQATSKSIPTLKEEITRAIQRLGGLIINFQRGVFEGGVSRDGFRVHYAVTASDGRQIPGRIDIAALPIHREINREKSLKMALYMFRQAMDGTWFLQKLSPGYSALVPFMLGKGTDKTISQLWSESSVMNNLLPPGDDDEFIDGEATEV